MSQHQDVLKHNASAALLTSITGRPVLLPGDEVHEEIADDRVLGRHFDILQTVDVEKRVDGRRWKQTRILCEMDAFLKCTKKLLSHELGSE